ncbi:MAG: hypothetical protein JW700_00675 [Candidatus Aenigmarchaeota archaeon]|nr:hypothetical protein [Candidatus Aenigmarchaeota archaeon]
MELYSGDRYISEMIDEKIIFMEEELERIAFSNDTKKVERILKSIACPFITDPEEEIYLAKRAGILKVVSIDEKTGVKEYQILGFGHKDAEKYR